MFLTITSGDKVNTKMEEIQEHTVQMHRMYPLSLLIHHRDAYKCNNSANYHTNMRTLNEFTSFHCHLSKPVHPPPASIFCFFNSFSLLPERLICLRVGGVKKNKLISQRGSSYTLWASASLVCLLRLHLLFPVSNCARLLYLHTWNLAASLLVALKVEKVKGVSVSVLMCK